MPWYGIRNTNPLTAGGVAPSNRAGVENIIANRIRSGRLWHTLVEGDDVQDVLDSAPDGEPSAPVVILCNPGLHRGEFFIRRSNVALVSLVPGAAVFLRDQDYGGGPDAGTLNVFDPDNPTAEQRFVYLDGLGVINSRSGSVGAGGLPPEPALSIGSTGSGGSGRWDHVFLSNLRAFGTHDAIQFFGDGTHDGSVFLVSNYAESCHDAVTIKARGRYYSAGNVYRGATDDAHPLITPTITDWKTTAWHLNVDAINGGMLPYSHWWRSSGDQFIVKADSHIGAALGNRAAGILVYAATGATQLMGLRFDGCSVMVEYAYDHIPTVIGAACGIQVEDNNTLINPGEFTFSGGSIEVHETVNGVNAIDVAGVYNNSAGATLWIIGTPILGSVSSAGVANSLRCAAGTIGHYVFSTLPTAGAGTLTQLTPVP